MTSMAAKSLLRNLALLSLLVIFSCYTVYSNSVRLIWSNQVVEQQENGPKSAAAIEVKKDEKPVVVDKKPGLQPILREERTLEEAEPSKPLQSSIVKIPQRDAPPATEEFSACLLVLDENPRLSEWIAYHWHVLPLQHLVIAVDPRSTASPEPILERFRHELNMTIEVWHDEDYASWKPLRRFPNPRLIQERHFMRQRVFLHKCMQHLKGQHNKTWTALWDADEYLVYNGYQRTFRNEHKTNHASVVTSPADMSEHGTVSKFLTQYLKVQGKALYCIPSQRARLGANITSKSMLPPQYAPLFDQERFDTLRFHYRNKLDGKKNGIGKSFLNVQMVKNESGEVNSPHRPSVSLCPIANFHITKDMPFMLNHYLGTWEMYSYRDDSRIGNDRSYEKWLNRAYAPNRVYQDEIVSWFPAFVRQVGPDRAVRLLQEAGLPPDYNISASRKEEFQCTEKEACAKLGITAVNRTSTRKRKEK